MIARPLYFPQESIILLIMNRYLALQKVVELESFSKAAAAMGCSQSAVSQMIASLEEELSMKLLNRFHTGVKLTIEGEKLYPYLEKTICHYLVAQEKAKEIQGLSNGQVRMGVLEDIAIHWLPLILRDYREQYPNVEFTIRQGDYACIQKWIKRDAIDFGFVNSHAVNGIKTISLKEDEMVALLPQGHPLPALDEIPLEQIAKEDFILLGEGRYFEPLEVFRSMKIIPNVKYTTHDAYAIIAMVEMGLGVAIVSKLSLARCNYNVVVRPTVPSVMRPLSIGYKDTGSVPIAGRYFIKFLREHLDQLP